MEKVLTQEGKIIILTVIFVLYIEIIMYFVL